MCVGVAVYGWACGLGILCSCTSLLLPGPYQKDICSEKWEQYFSYSPAWPTEIVENQEC